MPALPKNTTSYFDFSPRKQFSSDTIASTPSSISPGSSRQDLRPSGRRTTTRSRSDYDALHRRIHVQTVEEDCASHLDTQGSDVADPLPRPSTRKSVGGGEAAEPSPPNHAKVSAGIDSDSLNDRHAHGLPRPRLGRAWARSTSGSIWVRRKGSSADTFQVQSSNQSMPPTPGGGTVAIRTDQTPLTPPTARTLGTVKHSESNSIRVETPFVESAREVVEIESQHVVSRKSSINHKRIFSAPLLLVQRASLSKRRGKASPKETQAATPSAEDSRLADHPTLLKRNYTSDALHRVSAILQDVKSTSQSRPPAAIKPLRSRTLTKDRKTPHTIQGITTQLTFYQRKSAEQLSISPSYTSSQINLRMGLQPTNSPDECATYRVRRSSSVETEAFLKVDISIRGGTSYLPSEARRIHTPPLPEEGMDGKWRGFFFDYNAPRRVSSLDRDDPCEAFLSGGGAASTDVAQVRRATTVSKRAENSKCQNCRHVLTDNWYDIELAQLDQEDSSDGSPTSCKDDDKRAKSPGCLSPAELEREEEGFDLSIPEHLPSSPLCPRHRRYWRVVQGKGSQFRGC